MVTKKKLTEAAKLAAWLESPQAGLTGEERVQKTAKLLLRQERVIRNLVNATKAYGEANYFEDEEEAREAGQLLIKAVDEAELLLKETA